MKNKIYIFDTTLRDGEQAPGIHLNVREKIEIAEQLSRLNVDIIEAGFPISSASDFESVREVSRIVKNRGVAALARANDRDIDAAGEALEGAAQPVIHTFISSSDIHLKYQFKKTREEALEMAGKAVKRSRKYTDMVEFSAMDATRSDKDFLCRMFSQNQLGFIKTNVLRFYNLISRSVFQHSILMNTCFMGKCIFSHNSLVGSHHISGKGFDQPAGS